MEFSVCNDTCADYLLCGNTLGDTSILMCSGSDDFDETLAMCVADGTSTTCLDYD